ncbi:MAG: sigma 54-interacting transcriptional regulator [Geobacteraceae bacterium]|nr:sigma 54-interacting transcriptional regulator [Geobacteraceae bacterium]NTW79417.1 sigma 54-interacting transcriptional regulator [Geobacteraceae bacterium]
MSCRNIMDSVADGVFTVDKNMLITTYNRAAEEMTGYSHEEAIGKPCHEIFRTEVCQSDCPLKEALKEGKPVVSREVYILDKNGTRVPISVCASVLQDSEGNTIGGVETIRNLKDFSTILDSVADGVFTVDDQMVILSFNRAAEEITGYSHDEAIGKHCYEIFRSEACTIACPVKEAMATGVSVLNREVEIVDKSNNKKPISVSASVLVDSAGKARGGVETIRDLSFIHTLKNELHDKFTFQNLISRNPSMRRLFDVMADIASSEATVFLHGESGTGKELFARAIHDLSPRRKGPLVIVNCGALPETLLEAEIFGVRKGAYTGAVENRPGRLELCNGGTFFLDEIGDLPLQLQVKLLRVLENKEYQPLGAKNPLKADVRFITATHRNLAEMVEEGTFRRDLYFRINIVELNIPPLRERKEDIPLLLEIALKKFNTAYGKKVLRASPEVLKILLTHDFPGNVRELLNLIEQAVILCKGSEIGLDLMPKAFLLESNGKEKVSRRRSSKSPEVEVLCDVISRHKGNRTGAAQELGVDRSTLWRWVKSAGIEDF